MLHETSRNFLPKICAWLHVLPLYQNHIYTVFCPYLFGTVSQSYLRCSVSQAAVLLWAPNKTSCAILVLCFFCCWKSTQATMGSLQGLKSQSSKMKPESSQFCITTLRNQDFQPKVEVAVVQSLNHVWLFATPWTVVHQASLSFTISWSLLKLMSIESMPSNHLILCHPLLFLLSIFPSIRVFSNDYEHGRHLWKIRTNLGEMLWLSFEPGQLLFASRSLSFLISTVGATISHQGYSEQVLKQSVLLAWLRKALRIQMEWMDEWANEWDSAECRSTLVPSLAWVSAPVYISVQFSHSVMFDSATPWRAGHQASLSITNSWSLLKFMSIESVMPSNPFQQLDQRLSAA